MSRVFLKINLNTCSLILALHIYTLRQSRFVFCIKNIAINTDRSLFGHSTVYLAEFLDPFYITE